MGALAPIKRPPRRPKGSAGQYSRTTITLDLPTMRKIILNARRRNLTISGYVEQLVSAGLAQDGQGPPRAGA